MSTIPDSRSIRDAVRRQYAEVSAGAQGKFPYLTGRAGALALGYDPVLCQTVPPEVWPGFCGVGNPFALGSIDPGQAVLDAGCGAGVDLLLASRLVGPTGRACGVDLTPEMAACARINLQRSGVENAEVREASLEEIPYGDGVFDVVLSNGVFNLCPDKKAALREIRRVVRPGGRLQFADIVLRSDLPREIVGSLEAWSH